MDYVLNIVNTVSLFVIVVLGIAFWDMLIKKRLFPKRTENLVYTIDPSLKREDETLTDFVNRANEEDLGIYELI